MRENPIRLRPRKTQPKHKKRHPNRKQSYCRLQLLLRGQKNMRRLVFSVILLFAAILTAPAQDLHIPLPKKSKYTPVQKLNRDGVQALKKHSVDKAKKLFYKAYLIDPNDPFTLNNLGYVSELEGDIDRAQRYYDQAKANTSDALVDRSTEEQVEGKSVATVAGHTEKGPLKLNEMNSEAGSLLGKD